MSRFAHRGLRRRGNTRRGPRVAHNDHSSGALRPYQANEILFLFEAGRFCQDTNNPIALETFVARIVENPLLGNTRKERIIKTIDLLSPFLQKLYAAYREQKIFYPLNFSKVAALIQEKAPMELLTSPCSIDDLGMIDLYYSDAQAR